MCYSRVIMHQLQHLRVRHLQIVEYMLANPTEKYEDISKKFQVTVPWISVIYRSQLFQAKLRQRLAEHEVMTDMTVLDQITGVAQLALQKTAAFVEHSGDPDYVLDVADKLLRRAGYGTSAAKVTVNNNQGDTNNTYIQVDAAVLAECQAVLNSPTRTLPAPAQIEGEAVRVDSERERVPATLEPATSE